MENEPENVYIMGPNFASTPERWRARFNSFFQAKRILRYASETPVTKEVYSKYVAENPGEGELLEKMQSVVLAGGIGTAVGLFGGTFQIYRWTKSPPLLITGALLSTVVGHAVADDIASWIYGTYKFDVGTTNEKLHRYAYLEARAKTEEAS